MSFCKSPLVVALVGLLNTLPVIADCFEREPPADRNNPEEVFAYQGESVLTQNGIDAAFSRIPDEDRLAFVRDGAQVDRLVRNIMKTEVIAHDAVANGFSEEPLVRERMIQAANKALAEAWMDQLLKNAPEADYEAMAREDFLAHPEDYQTDEYLDVSHILIGTEKRSEDEAIALALDLHQRAVDSPDSFQDLVAEYSDDRAKDRNKGRYLRVYKGQTAKPFEDAAFGLKNEGDVSQPVRTDFGFHVIRLDKRYAPRQRQFDEIRDEVVAEMEQKHRARYQELYIKGLLSDGIVLPEGSVEVMLKRYFGDDLEHAPQFKGD